MKEANILEQDSLIFMLQQSPNSRNVQDKPVWKMFPTKLITLTLTSSMFPVVLFLGFNIKNSLEGSSLPSRGV